MKHCQTTNKTLKIICQTAEYNCSFLFFQLDLLKYKMDKIPFPRDLFLFKIKTMVRNIFTLSLNLQILLFLSWQFKTNVLSMFIFRIYRQWNNYCVYKKNQTNKKSWQLLSSSVALNILKYILKYVKFITC